MTTGLPVFDTTVQETNLWLKAIESRLPPCSRQEAYAALRAVLHVLRDRLPMEAVLGLSAQLPLLLRGVFLEGWRPAAGPTSIRDPKVFADEVAELLAPTFPCLPLDIVDAVCAVLAEQLDTGEVSKLERYLPPRLRSFFPVQPSTQDNGGGMSRKLLFLLADGGRARFVERSQPNGHFVTFAEIDRTQALSQLRSELRASPPARTHASTSPRRSAVGKEDYIRPAKEAFMAEVAERAVALVRERQLDGVFLAAPSQLISPLRAHLDGAAPVVGAIRKDLTKVQDHDLGAWLSAAHASLQPSL